MLALLVGVVQGVLANNASALTGTPCLQTGLETIATDEPSYPAGATVHITGTGYAVGCDVVVQVTRPDSVVDSETVSTDLAGGVAYDYVIPGPPYATGTYLVDVLGDGSVLAQTSFEDAAAVNQLLANGPVASGTQTFIFTVGDTIYSNGTIDAGRNGRILIADGNGINRFTSACLPEASFEFNAVTNPNGPPRYTFLASDPVSTDNAHQWTYTVQQFAPADTTCSGATQSTASRDFSFAKASVFSNAALTTPKSSFAAGQTPYVTVDGFDPNRNDLDVTWLLPTGPAACANTSAGDRPDSTPGGVLPDPADSSAASPSTDGLQYPPRAQNVGADDPWNYNQSYDGFNAVSNPTPCPALGSGNQGTWKLMLQRDATHVTTLTVFVVDTTAPNVTINQASGQVDPTAGTTIHFTAVFSEAVTGFTGSDVSFVGSTSGGTKTATVTEMAPNDGTTYDVSVTGMSSRGTVVATIPADAASDAAGNASNASTSTDNTVTWDRVPAATAPTFSPASPKTNDSLTASTTTSDPDGDNISVSWTWKVNRGGNVCTVQTSSSAAAPAGVRTAVLDLSQNYAPTSCTGAMINPLNPSKGDVVRVEATPNDGLFDGTLQSSNITIVNTAPVVALSGANATTVSEGSTHGYGYSIVDADGDSIPSVTTSCGANGTKSNDSHTNSSGSFDCTFPDGPASSVVSVQATDSGFGAAPGNTDTQLVTVNNVAPTVTLSAGNDLSVAEGSTHTYSYTISDPGQDTVTSVTTSCSGTGTKVAGSDSFTNTSGSFQCSFADGPNSSTVSASATDSDGDTGAADTQSATVNNVAPTVTLSATNDLSVDEGSTHTYSYTISDPGQDTVSSVATSCGANGTMTNPTNDNSSGSFDCTFPDGPVSSTVSAQATDSDGDTGNNATQSVTVNNVAPTVTLSAGNALSVNEGSTHTYTYTISDPGLDTVSSVATSCGAMGSKSNASNTNTSGQFDCTFPDGPASSTVSAQATDSDGDTGNNATQSVTVNNVAPTLTLSAGDDLTVNEGSTHTYSYTISDPGVDTVSSVATSCGANGTKSNASNGNTSGQFDCTFPDGPASSTVSAQATDSDGDTGNDATQSVTVNNVAPMVTLSSLNDLSVNEGSTRTYAYTISDPGQDTVDSVTTSCSGTGSKVSGSDSFTNSSGSFQCAFADGPNSSTVSASATDDDGDTGAADTQLVTVNNVAPTVTLSPGNDLAVAEGSTHTYSYTISDPGQDTVDSVTTSCSGTGSKVSGSDSFTNSSGSFQCAFADGPNSSTVSAAATDSDGDIGNTDTQSVTVNNVAPTVSLSGPASVDEGSTHTYTFSVSDPGDDTFSVSAGYPQCGTGGTYVSGSLTTNSTGGSFQCTFPDGPATTELRIRVADSDGASDTDSEAVHVVEVGNANPVVTAAADQSTAEGEAHSFTLGSFSDPGPDAPWSVSIDWGDGSAVTSFTTSATGSLGSSTHTYADGPATRTVTVTVTDANGGSGSDTFAVDVDNVAPTVTLSGGNDLSVSEGSTHTYSYAISDPGLDTVNGVTTSCGLNGTKSNDSNTNTSGSFDCTFPDGPANSTVSAQASDSDGDAGNTDTQSVSVANVAPSTPNLLSPADGATTGDNTPTLDWSDSTDPGVDTVTYTIQVDDSGCAFASPEIDEAGIATSQLTPVTSLPDGMYCWRVRATDSDTDSSAYSATRQFTIDTSLPSVTIDQASGQADPTNASPVHFTAAFSEPVTGFGGGDVTIGGTAGGSKTVTVTDSGDHMTYDVAVSGMTDGTVVASVAAGAAQDGAGNGNTASTSTDNSVTYDNTSPSVTVNQSAGQADPTSASPIRFTAVFSEPVTGFQNGDVTIGGTAGGSKTASVTNPSSDSKTFDIAITGMTTDGTVTVSIGASKAEDGAGNGNSASTSTDNTVTWVQQVQNTAPVVTIGSPTFGQLYAKGSANVSLAASFTDPDAGQTHTCSINWDDGAVTSPPVNEAARTCSQAHTYVSAGVYTINVTICDNAGGCGSAEVWVVVYDPSAGFVTGGGWINVAAGSYPADPTLTGRANFGFNSKYKNGGAPPTGETEFNFSLANFNFRSTNYQWLVVSSYKAQYRGTGTVNGVSGYDFRLTAYDGQISGGGGIDKFRIKITRNGQTIFDNRMGVPEDPDVADPQAIAGGSIVIHRS